MRMCFRLLFLIIPFITMAHDFRVLVFSKTEGFRHGSISSGITMIEQLGIDNNFDVVATEDASLFTFDYLKDFQAVIFLSTTGNILNNSQQQAFERYIQNGGGYVGIHSASDTEYDWPWYGDLVGAYFKNHPPGTSQASIKVSDRVHPSTEGLPFSWARTDEWYNYRANPRGKVHVLATLDEKSYSGGDMGWDHPIAWCREFDGGRSWYTGGGHTNSSYAEPLFIEHVLGGIYYAVGEIVGEFDATVDDNFEVSIIDNNPSNPMSLAILPDLKVMYAERGGKIKLYNQSTGSISTAATISVDTGREDGLLGLVLDPNFESNNYLYVFYSPAGNQSKQHVSRFTLVNNQLDMSSEKILLEIPTQRDTCCHSGGDLEFDNNGLLYISVGDNINPFQSDGYTPIDERNNRKSFDAQGTSSDTKDLRGKILRIRPEPNGTYSIPPGNLFTNSNEGLPEIYAMGVRNPFRISVGLNGTLFFGDVGPDANSDNSNRGPKGHDEFNKTKTSGNFGWPYCIANNKSYTDYNFANDQSGNNFNCNNPTNNSPNNKGISSLPESTSSWIWYSDGSSNEFPSMGNGGGRVAMAGPIYSFDNASSSDSKFPEYYNDSVFLFEWSRNWIREVKLDDNGDIVKINPFYNSLKLVRPIDMAFGPDGAMYIIEWGKGFAGDNADARVIKIAYKSGNRVPIAIAEANPSSGTLPLVVDFNADKSFDPDIADMLTYEWDFDGDGIFDATGITTSHTYTTLGDFSVQLKVTDNQGLSSFSNLTITAGNNAPIVTLQYPENGGFFIWGEQLEYSVDVSDVEDGSITNGMINCDEVTGIPSIGHDDHIHDLNPIMNCDGDFLTQTHGDDADNVFYVFRGSYTDKGASGVSTITRSSNSVLQPKKKEAEHYSSQQGIQLEDTNDDFGGGKNIGFINSDDYISFEPINLRNITHITFRSASNTSGGLVEVRMDSPQGTLLGERFLPSTGDWQTWDYFSMPIQDPGGTHELFFVFKGGSGFLFNLNWIEFHGKGVAINDKYALNGLKAFYYNSDDFSGTPIIKKDPLVAFDWEGRSPIPGINADNFSVKWEGFLEVDETGDYSLFTKHTGNLLRLTLSGQQLINETTSSESTSNTVALVAGQKYPILIEYTHTNGNAAVSLGWNENNTIYMSNLSVDGLLSTPNKTVNSRIKIYPNPVDKHLHIMADNNFEYDVIKLYSITGALVKQWNINRATEKKVKEINLSNLQSGVYFLSVSSPENIIYERIIKK